MEADFSSEYQGEVFSAIFSLFFGLKEITLGVLVLTTIFSTFAIRYLRTSYTGNDAKLSLARATVTANYLKGLGVKAKITTNGKGIYRIGGPLDRRAEIEIVWIK